MLEKQYRLKRYAQIQEVRHKGQSWRNRWLVLSKQTNGRLESRFAFSVSRRVGNAVTRNRIKRLMREAIRHRLPSIRGGWDVLLIARTPIREARFAQVNRAVADLLQQAHLRIDSPSSTPTRKKNGSLSPPSHVRSPGETVTET